METKRKYFTPMALLCGALILAACAASPTGTAGNNTAGGKATATTAPTATPKPKPTSVPTTSTTYCQGLLSLTEVNSIMQPPAAATNILFENDTSDGLSACSWAAGQSLAVLAVFFLPFPTGTSMTAAVQQQMAKTHIPAGGSVNTTPVSGVGDQALYVSAAIPTPNGTEYVAALDVADGAVLIGCTQTGAGSVPAGAQGELTQACKLVVSRL